MIVVNCVIAGLNAVINLLQGLWKTFNMKTVVFPNYTRGHFVNISYPYFVLGPVYLMSTTCFVQF